MRKERLVQIERDQEERGKFLAEEQQQIKENYRKNAEKVLFSERDEVKSVTKAVQYGEVWITVYYFLIKF